MSNAVSSTGILVKRQVAVGTIVSNSIANPTVLTFATAQGWSTGDVVTIAGNITSSPAINGSQTLTRITSTTFSVPVNVTVAGTGGTVTASATFVTIGEITKVGPPGFSRNKIETSTHNDGTESYILGILRQKDASFTINYVGADTTHLAMLNDMLNNIKANWKVLFPSAVQFDGLARLQMFQLADAPVDGAQQADMSICWAGPVTQS